MKFNKEKYIKIIQHLMDADKYFKKMGEQPKYDTYDSLATTLYFIDFDYYVIYEESMTGERYFRIKGRIVPFHLWMILYENMLNGTFEVNYNLIHDLHKTKKFFKKRFNGNYLLSGNYLRLKDV